jgi:hypothetical protein
MKFTGMVLGCFGAAVLFQCSAWAETSSANPTLGAVVTNLVQRAEAGDVGFFKGLLGSSDDAVVTQVIRMVQRSGMLTNYTSRFESSSPTSARLNYHWLERHCHFQVDLHKDKDAWGVKRIGLCR